MSSALSALKARMYDANALGVALQVLDWDQQTYMPPGGAEARGAHVGILSRIRHELVTSDETGELIAKSEAEAESQEDKALLRCVKRDYEKSTCIPAALVEEKSRLSIEAHEVWVKARKGNNFAEFAPYLKRLVEITREEAELFGYKDHIYDALIDLYEEGATKADCDAMFNGIRQPLVDLVKAIKEAPKQPDDSFLYGDWDQAGQKAFTEKIVTAIGFDFERGRQDTAPHPFCTNFSIGDVRLTTRYKPYLASAIFGSLHEAGHGMYEQGSPMEWDRSALAGGVSLGVHESQSRTWENLVGRSKAFWSVFYGDLQSQFPALQSKSLDEFLFAVNKVEPSLIRVEADEVTYNLHIMVRFELECMLLTGEIKVEDVPEVWNAKYEEYLGIRPPSDADGCLQDVHWSMGAIGYFPTYSMGNVLSGQFWAAMEKELGDLDKIMADGKFSVILDWLKAKIYSKGKLLAPKDLAKSVSGKTFDPSDYLRIISAKYKGLYSI